MNELVAKVPESQPYDNFDTYKAVRDSGVKIELLSREVMSLRAELEMLKNIVLTLKNGN